MKKMKFLPLAAMFLGTALIFSSCQNDAEEVDETTQEEQSEMDFPESVEGGVSTYDFTDDEINKFVAALNSIQAHNQQVQEEMMQVIADDKFEMERFNQIYQSEQSPEMELEVPAKEKARYDATMKKIEDMQAKAANDMDKFVMEAGLSTERYEEIMQAAQQDQALQMEIMQKMGGPGQGPSQGQGQ